MTAYARTKRMQVVLAEEWAKRLPASAVHAAHPGWVDTPGIADSLPPFKKLTRPILRTPEQGADTFVWLAAAREPGEITGRFWHDRAARPEHYTPPHARVRDRSPHVLGCGGGADVGHPRRLLECPGRCP